MRTLSVTGTVLFACIPALAAGLIGASAGLGFGVVAWPTVAALAGALLGTYHLSSVVTSLERVLLHREQERAFASACAKAFQQVEASRQTSAPTLN